ncbi:helix-turn-helix domain-containing protein [Flectobacillus sp. DC10W]|jgi:excisionase family DNA binding protein|uniref:Helix-turn-helix domain-containing protein n=1 Tax=Flectobacillus longus TaxID=2984207 RepID=A0ABT6YKR4_9BACT|nr:helix-turn-helix domain-containing protein [Flectobacillus longus]MDI9863743.1 helix-turn-helix domain-containing protein [Flectobacillus longus]
MLVLDEIKIPTKLEQLVALKSYLSLASVVETIRSEQTEIEIEETKSKISIPVSALKMLGDILKAMGEGKSISIIPVSNEVTTQRAAEILGCSRPHFVKILEEGKIPFTKIGKHRRILLEDVLQFKELMKEEQKKHLIEMMNLDEAIGLYDS